MSFGVSGNDKKSQMIGGDVTVAWMDHATGIFLLITAVAEISIETSTTIKLVVFQKAKALPRTTTWMQRVSAPEVTELVRIKTSETGRATSGFSTLQSSTSSPCSHTGDNIG